MKKAALIMATILLIAGLAVSFAAFASAGFDLRNLATVKAETKTYTAEGTFDRIEIRENTADITFAVSEDETATVVCRETAPTVHTVTVEDGTLKIVSEETIGWRNLFELSFDSPSVTVYLPKKAYASLSIETQTGDVEVPDWMTFDGAAIHGSTSDVRFDAKVKNLLSIETSTGDISVNGISAETIDCKATTGQIRMQNVTCTGDVTVKVSTGKAILEGLTCRDLKSDGSTGDVVLQDVLAEGCISIERGTGDVTFRNSDAAEIQVKTGTGDVTGTLRTEKIFVTKTSTGDVRVPDSVSGGRCEITTATGDIRILIATAR